MFERFAAEARQVLVVAQEEALLLGHGHIGTEHILLGLLGTSDGVAAAVLRASGVDAATVRAAVERVVGRGRPGRDDASALRAIGIDLDVVRAAVEGSFGPGALERATPAPRRRRPRRCLERPGNAAFTPRSKKVLELALRQSLTLRHDHIGAEHILLGLLAEGQGLGCRILLDAGARLHDISRRTLAALGEAA